MLSVIGDVIKFLSNVDLDKLLQVVAAIKELIKILEAFFDNPNTPNVNGIVA